MKKIINTTMIEFHTKNTTDSDMCENGSARKFYTRKNDESVRTIRISGITTERVNFHLIVIHLQSANMKRISARERMDVRIPIRGGSISNAD